MPSRFVILHHQTAGGEHWDLMLQRGGGLLTWQLLREPDGVGSLPIPATRKAGLGLSVGDHRLAYLTYEGPISRNRGTVRRVDEGTVSFADIADNRVCFELAGGHLSGRFDLRRQGGDEWTLAVDAHTAHTTPATTCDS